MAGWVVENSISDAQSLCAGVWGWVPEQYFDINLLIDRAEREVYSYFIISFFLIYFDYYRT